MTFREQLSFLADFLGIITGLMAIIGVGGILTWGKLIGFKNERLRAIYGYLAIMWRFSLVLPLTFVFFYLADRMHIWIYFMIRDAFSSWSPFAFYIQESKLISNIAYIGGLVVVVPPLLFIAIVMIHCLVVGNLDPAKHFISQLYKPKSKSEILEQKHNE